MTNSDLVTEASEELPPDLVPGAIPEEYEFPDVRRRIYGASFVSLASLSGLAAALVADDWYINRGWVAASLLGLAVGVYMFACSWKLRVPEKDAILRVGANLSFPLGPASISLGWKGVLSKPVWRLLAYSGEEPRPKRRGFVVLDAVSGALVEKIDEENPEDHWV